ncbi:TIGR01777 family oxidoreductase [Georgenia sp. EYE_87]|uniref:TIGR01777 family oxidoreductase n=1 Tax=Georgenia sp. EYE_87 TaxID=2853448 RepID=UPI0020031816|nr:TIGR01777 family oxidoreductase [Georgenia sp. EYE_87]MCK6209357.1 TIGR01777 family oxidoreductase [Georgenia sp. EYE_87]
MATAAVHTAPEAPHATTRTVLVAGSSGFLGHHLLRHLRRRGDRVRRLVRREPRGPEEVRWDPAGGSLEPTALEGVDVVVNLGGASLGRLPWTPAYKEEILCSRVDGARVLAESAALAVTRHGRRVRFLQASGTDFYGDRGEQVLTEASGPGAGFLAEVCQQWEAATTPAADAGADVVLLRTSPALAPSGGAIAPLTTLIRLGLGGPIAGGRHWFPWITLADHVRAQLHLMDSALAGPVNLTAPGAARQGELVDALASAMHRPAVVHAPRWALALAGRDFADFLASSRRVEPRALLDDGFTFSHPDLAAAAPWVADRRREARR